MERSINATTRVSSYLVRASIPPKGARGLGIKVLKFMCSSNSQVVVDVASPPQCIDSLLRSKYGPRRGSQTNKPKNSSNVSPFCKDVMSPSAICNHGSLLRPARTPRQPSSTMDDVRIAPPVKYSQPSLRQYGIRMLLSGVFGTKRVELEYGQSRCQGRSPTQKLEIAIGALLL